MKLLPEFGHNIEMRVHSEVTGENNRFLMNSRKLTLPFDETTEFHGVGAHWSGDELFLGSILVSLSNTFLYFVRKLKGRFTFTRLALKGGITIAYDEISRIYLVKNIDVTGRLDVPAKCAMEGKRLWDLTEKACHILHSIDKQITTSIKITIQEL